MTQGVYTLNTGQNIVLKFLIDDGVPDRGHRIEMFSPFYFMAAIATGPIANPYV